MGVKRPSQLFWSLAVLALAACSTPVAELTDGGTSGATGGASTGGTSAGGTGGSSGTAGTSGGISGTGGTSAGSGSSGGNTTGGAGSTGGGAGSSGGTGGNPDAGNPDAGPLGQNCLIQNSYDPCLIYGLVCRQSQVPGELGYVCQLPSEFEACFPQVGCSAADLQCLTVFTPMCVHTCQSNSTCPSLFTSCQTFGTNQVCYFDQCNLSAGDTFGTCDSTGTGDGTCVPNPYLGGLCLGGGDAGAGDNCLDHRTPNSSPSDFCGFAQACLPLGQPAGGHCAPLCGEGDAGPFCPSPTFCVPSGQGAWGYCL
jgi:hypothetical protein